MLCACTMFRRTRSSGAASIIAAKAAADSSPFSTSLSAAGSPLPLAPSTAPAFVPPDALDDDEAAARLAGEVEEGGGCCGGGTQNGDRARSIDRGVGGSRRPTPRPRPRPGARGFLPRSLHRPFPAMRGTPSAEGALFARRPSAGEDGEPCLEELRRSGEEVATTDGLVEAFERF